MDGGKERWMDGFEIDGRWRMNGRLVDGGLEGGMEGSMDVQFHHIFLLALV